MRAGRLVGVGADILRWVERWRGLSVQVCAEMCRWRLIVSRRAEYANGSAILPEPNNDTKYGETGMGSERV